MAGSYVGRNRRQILPGADSSARGALSRCFHHVDTMTSGRRPITGRDAAGAGMLMLSVNLLCAAVGAGVGALVGALVPLLLVGFFIGFFLGIRVVAKRFQDL
jgi:hypothetical protein